MEHESIITDWANICLNHPVPSELFAHQIDAMALLKKCKHLLLGNLRFSELLFFNSSFIAVPTGAGKTLPQLATILLLEGKDNLRL